MIHLPEELTLEEFDRIFSSKQVKTIKNSKFLSKDMVIYTQIDGNNDRIYFKGIHYVNRTGIFKVIKYDV